MKTRALTLKELNNILVLLKTGFTYKDIDRNKIRTFRSKIKIYYLLFFQVNTGLRVGDILRLRKKDILNARINIIEQKTKKQLSRSYPKNTYKVIIDYCSKYNIEYDDLLFDNLNVRTVQKNLKSVIIHLKLKDISTHSFRKTFATLKYKESKNNIELVRRLLNHSNTSVTQRYLGISDIDLEKISSKSVFNI